MKSIEQARAELVAREIGFDPTQVKAVDESDKFDPTTWIITGEKPDASCMLLVMETKETLHPDDLVGRFVEVISDQGCDCGHATDANDPETVLFFGTEAERVRHHMEAHNQLKASALKPQGFGN